MTTRPIHHTAPTMHLNSPRTTPGSRDPLNHIPLPSMCRTTHLNPTIMRLTVPLLTPFRIQRSLNGTARRGRRSVSLWRLQHPFKRHPFPLPSTDRSPRTSLHRHPPRPRPPRSAYILLPPSHNPTQRRGEHHLGPPRLQIRLPSPSASRGRRKSPLLGIPHRWRQLR